MDFLLDVFVVDVAGVTVMEDVVGTAADAVVVIGVVDMISLGREKVNIRISKAKL